MNPFLDITVLVIYFVAVFYAGFRFSSKGQSSNEFFLAKHRIGWGWLLLSLVATETSSLTFLSIPALGMKSDFSFLQLAMGYILGRTFVAIFLLPKYYKEDMISVYSYLGDNFGKPAQKTMSFLFTVSRILGDGIRLYVTSLPIAFLIKEMGVTNLSESEIEILALFLLSLATIVYTVYGGFKAIVFTDSLQLFIYLVGGFFSLVLLIQAIQSQTSLPFAEVFIKSHEAGKFQIFHFQWVSDTWDPYFFIFAILGGAFLSIGSHGTDLMLVQRVVASHSLREGQKILISSGFLVFFQFTLFLLIGAFLNQFYQGTDIAPDKAFSLFIVKEIPSPILGFLLAAILASAMSTLSSTINSLSLTWSRDWGLEERTNPRQLSLFFGIVLFFASLLPFSLSSQWEKGLLEVGLTIFSFTLGPSLALFLLAAKKEKPSLPSYAIPVLLLVSVCSLVIVQKTYVFPFTLLVPMGAIIFFGLFQLMSLVSKSMKAR